MARVSSVTKEKVDHACRKLFAQGMNPTFPKVYELLGNEGSSKLVQQYISEWRTEVSKTIEPEAVPGVPKDVSEVWGDMLKNMWPNMLQAAENQFNERRAEIEAQLEAERARMNERLQSAQDGAHAAQALLQSAESDITLLRAKNQDLNEKVADLAGRLEQEAEARQRIEEQLVDARRDFGQKEERFNNRVAELEARVEALRAEHADALLAERRERAEEQERQHRKHQGELAERHATITKLRSQVAEQIEALASLGTERAELAGKAAHQAKENQRLLARVADQEEQLREARQERSAAEARAQAVDEFRKSEGLRIADLESKLERASDRIWTLQNEIVQLRQAPPTPESR